MSQAGSWAVLRTELLLLLNELINHLKRGMTGSEDRAVPQPSLQGNAPQVQGQVYCRVLLK